MTTDAPRRLLLEGMVIVASILLAFAIDAAWDGHERRGSAADLRREIRQDIVNTQTEIVSELGYSLQTSKQARALLEAMAKPPATAQRDSIIATLGSIFNLKLWRPVNDAYLEATGSGRLALIDDEETRLALSRYQLQLDNIRALVNDVSRQYYEQQEPFMVANVIYSEVASSGWKDALVTAPFKTDYDRLAKSTVLWNLLTFRLELETAMQQYLRLLNTRAKEALVKLN